MLAPNGNQRREEILEGEVRCCFLINEEDIVSIILLRLIVKCTKSFIALLAYRYYLDYVGCGGSANSSCTRPTGPP
jgi:hypothetical protein